MCKTTLSRTYAIFLQLWFLVTAPFRSGLVTHEAPSVHHIDYASLKKTGVSLIIFDLDDTLANWHRNIPKKIEDLFLSLQKDMGMSVVIFTNSTKKRVGRVEKALTLKNIFILQNPNKPMVGGYKKILSRFNIAPEKVAMVGDRLATDMWGAKRAGIPVRILVEPYSKYLDGQHSPLIQKAIRTLEKIMNGYYLRSVHGKKKDNIEKRPTSDSAI